MTEIIALAAEIARLVTASWLIFVAVGVLPNPEVDLVALCVAMILLVVGE